MVGAKNQSAKHRKESEQINTRNLNIQIEPLYVGSDRPTDIKKIVQGLITETQEQLQKQSITDSLLQKQASQAKERQQNRNKQPLILQMRDQSLKRNTSNNESELESGQSLNKRKNKMLNLQPLDTFNEETQNLNNLRSNQSPQGRETSNNLQPKKHNSSSHNSSFLNSAGSVSPSAKKKFLSNNINQLQRRQTIMKFQSAVKQAVEYQKQQTQDKTQLKQSLTQRGEQKYMDTVTSNQNLNTDSLFSSNQYFLSRPDQNKKSNLPVPMTPMLKRNKMSFFDVVKSLNPFRKAEHKEEVKVADINTELYSMRSYQIDGEEKRRERAQQLWKKAKSVLRAINIWKQIQTDIQLYGTHNYEFRQNFKITQNQNLLTKTTSIRREILEGIPRNKFKPYIHPESRFKKFWSLIIIIFLVYTGTLMPYKLAFLDGKYGDAWYILDVCANFCFFIDVFVNSFSAYYDEDGILIIDNRVIFSKYLRSWFVWDVIASFPITVLEINDSKLGWQVLTNINYIIRLFRLPRLYVLVRFTKLGKVIEKFNKNKAMVKIQEFIQLNAGVWKLLIFALTGCICIHVSACFWFLSSKISDFDPNTWVVRSQIQDESDGRKYLTSIYWSVSTVLTVGYGDIHAESNAERVISVVWMMIGVVFYSVVIGLITAILGKIDSRSSQLKSKLEIIDQFCQEAYVSIELQRKIKDALEYHSNRNAFSYIENYSILNEIPPQLKCEIAMQIHSGKIGRLPFFSNKDQSFIGNIVPLLQPLRVLANDYIYMLDDHPYDIYFIVDGRVNLIMEIAECVFKSWPQGAYFGEIEIIFQKKRICTAKAEQDCDLFTLNKKYYQTTIYNDYPEIEKQLRELALEREAKINQTLEKARRVLESIGIRDALLLPTRQRRNSITSQNVAKKRREAFKKSTMNKVAKSFDEAHRSLSMSEYSMQKSNKTLNNTSMINQLNKSQTSPKKQQEINEQEENDESSSSGDFNIWGDNHKSDSDKDSLKTDQSMKDANKQQKSESPTKVGGVSPSKVYNNYDRFKEIFEQQKLKQNNYHKFATIKSEAEKSSSSSSSNRSSDSNSSMRSSNSSLESSSINKKTNQKPILVKRFQNDSDDSLQTSKSLKSGFDSTLPQIKIFQTTLEQQQSQNENNTDNDIVYKNKDHYLSPPNVKNQNIAISPLKNPNNFLSNEEIIGNLIRQHTTSNSSPSHRSVKQEKGSKFKLQVKKAAVSQINSPNSTKSKQPLRKTLAPTQATSIINREQSKFSKQVIQNNSSDASSSFNSTEKGKEQKIRELVLSPIPHSKYQNLSDLQVQRKTFQIEIFNPNIIMQLKNINLNTLQNPVIPIKKQSQQQLEDINQERQLKEMSQQLKRVKGHFQGNSNQYENMEFKVQTLQQSIDLMAKMLKDIGQKQMQKQFQSHREEVKRNKIAEPSATGSFSTHFKPPSSGNNINHQKDLQERHSRNYDQNKLFKRDKNQRYDQYKTKMQKYNAAQFQQLSNKKDTLREFGLGSMGSTDWFKHSFTLDSNDSLIPITRNDNRENQLMSTTVDDRKKETAVAFSYSEDLEILQRDYGDPEQLNNNNNRNGTISFNNSQINQSLPDQ